MTEMLVMNHWKTRTGRGVKIVVVDSGVNRKHKDMIKYTFNGCNLVNEEAISSDIEDQLGHGTGVVSIIKKMSPDAEIYILKIFQDKLEVNEESLIKALEYIDECVDCDLLHLSLGLTVSGELTRLLKVCQSISRKGVCIVSAFDNNGAISYPAAFDCVVGVDSVAVPYSEYEYEFVGDNRVNIRARGVAQRVPWLEQRYLYIGGSSFAAAYVTGYIAKIIEAGKSTFPDIMDTLKASATRLRQLNDLERSPANTKEKFKIRKAIIFPFNKEMHSIIRFQDLLPFQVVAVYDSKYSGNVGSSTNSLLQLPEGTDHVILNVDKITGEEDFDTVILGHTENIATATGIDYCERMIRQSITYKKNIYVFDDLLRYTPLLQEAKKNNCEVFIPRVGKDNLPRDLFGKLERIGKPVVGIFGTSSRQGKFTLQLTLRRYFLRDGYSVAQLGTEPSSLLYGFDEVYPMGYGSTVSVAGYDSIRVLNHMMGNLARLDPDIIIVGSQSGTVPYDTGNISQYTLPQLEFLLGTIPDVCVVCVNSNDPTEYIQRTIRLIENLIRTKVIGLVVFPFQKILGPLSGFRLMAPSGEDLSRFRGDLKKNTGLDVYLLNDERELEFLYQSIVDFFS